MARITVEDCLEHVANRFELVALASRRARQIANGASALIDEENDKPTVIALREIAAGLISTEILDQQAKEREEQELAALELESQSSDFLTEEISQLLMSEHQSSEEQSSMIEGDDDLMGFQTESSSDLIKNNIIDDNDEELLG